MGYYTKYTLTIEEGNNGVTDYEREISERSEYSNCFDAEIKWYTHSKEMRAYSMDHPKTVFKLYMVGEIAGDIYVAYFKNGKRQVCDPTDPLDKYNESLLSYH